MKIINKQSIIGIEKHFIEAQLRTMAWKTLLDNSEELLWRSMVFITVLYLVRTKNIKEVRDTFLQGLKKKKRKEKKDQHIHKLSMNLAPGKGVLSLKEYQHWHPRKGGI